jgi:prepilin-type N-terminal cleavage/methylation domain-containing protein
MMMSHTRRTPPKRRRPVTRTRRGMSLVELMVAVVLLGVGLLSMAAFSYAMTVQQRHSMNQQTASMVVQSRIDSLSSIRCQSLAPSGTVSGVTVTRKITEKWSITDGNDVKIIRDTLTFAGRKNPLAYISVIPCRD